MKFNYLFFLVLVLNNFLMPMRFMEDRECDKVIQRYLDKEYPGFTLGRLLSPDKLEYAIKNEKGESYYLSQKISEVLLQAAKKGNIEKIKLSFPK